MQVNNQEATSVLTQRIKSLEESLEISRKEANQALSELSEMQSKLKQRETECDDLVSKLSVVSFCTVFVK